MPEGLKISRRGQGPELVLLHGWAAHSGIWGSAADALADRFSLHLVDLPGHGRNRHLPLSKDLGEVAGRILAEVPPAAWLGWSLGGLVTLAAALQQPQRVHKALLVGSTPCFCQRADWDCGALDAARRAFTGEFEKDHAAAIDGFGLQVYGPPWQGEALRRLGVSAFSQRAPARRDLRAGLDLLYGSNLLPFLGDLEMPVLFLGGARDRTVRPESMGRAASLVRDGRAALIPGAGHAPFISHAEVFVEIVSGFVLAGAPA